MLINVDNQEPALSDKSGENLHTLSSRSGETVKLTIAHQL